MNLHTPPEPEHVKEWIRSVEKQTGGTPGVRWDRLDIWYGLELPRYLWSEWKGELQKHGFNWQKFLRLLKHRTDIALMWYGGACTWEQYIAELVELIKSPLGERISSS